MIVSSPKKILPEIVENPELIFGALLCQKDVSRNDEIMVDRPWEAQNPQKGRCTSKFFNFMYVKIFIADF